MKFTGGQLSAVLGISFEMMRYLGNGCAIPAVIPQIWLLHCASKHMYCCTELASKKQTLFKSIGRVY
jgi:hypothetical protein